MKIFTKDQFKTMPWKNGGGTTTELIRFPPESSDFTLRLSIANVSKSGPFSIFPEIERHLLILDGNGIKLSFPDKKITLTTESQAIQFKGEENIDCELINGAVKDFNVMIRRSFGSADVSIQESPEIKCDDKILYIYSCQEERLFELIKGERIKLKGKCVIVKIKKGS